MALYHFQNFPGFLGAVLFSALFPAPYSSSYLAWALLASPAAGSARGSVPQGITLWVEAPMVNPAPREGLWVSGLVPPWLLSIRVSQQAHSPLQARPLSPPRLGSVLCFALRLSFNRAQSWPPVSLAWPTSKPDPDSRPRGPTGHGSHRFKTSGRQSHKPSAPSSSARDVIYVCGFVLVAKCGLCEGC